MPIIPTVIPTHNSRIRHDLSANVDFYNYSVSKDTCILNIVVKIPTK